MTFRKILIASAAIGLAFQGQALAQTFDIDGSDGMSLTAETLENFSDGWAMTFLPDGRMLVTERTGALWLLDETGSKLGQVTGVPEVTPRNQGGLGDIILAPDFETSGTVYVSFVERDEDDDTLSGAAVMMANLSLSSAGGALTDGDIIWRQHPKMTGNGHYSHRLVFSPDSEYLYITSGERQHFTPAQNMDMNLGKVIRLFPDGSIPEDNPFYEGQNSVTSQIWSLGHRNLLGIDFDAEGRLWEHEMGPKGGDELNIVLRGENYGYPVVSNGTHYSGVDMPNHEEIPIYTAPKVSWTPVISPAGFVIYDGSMFQDWTGDGFIGGLSSKALIRVDIDGEEAEEAARYEWDRRIREVEVGPDGALYVLEDEEGRLLRLTPGE